MRFPIPFFQTTLLVPSSSVRRKPNSAFCNPILRNSYRKCDVKRAYFCGIKAGIFFIPQCTALRVLLLNSLFSSIVGCNPTIDLCFIKFIKSIFRASSFQLSYKCKNSISFIATHYDLAEQLVCENLGDQTVGTVIPTNQSTVYPSVSDSKEAS